MLSNDEWLLPLGSNNVDLSEENEGIPQGADWLVSLLQTLHDRYTLLPQPGHRYFKMLNFFFYLFSPLSHFLLYQTTIFGPTNRIV